MRGMALLKKIGILTYFWSDNPGSFLQALAVLRQLEKRFSEYHIEGYPSILIGRLAIEKKWQRKGIGRFLISKIIKNAVKSSEQFGIRLVVVQAKKDAFEVYEKLGFQYVEHSSEDKRYRARGTRTMFFDLKSLKTV